jgi:hypothetical protein
VTGPEHYREGERLLAIARASKDTTFEGHNPEADRLIAEATAHFLAAQVALAALTAPIAGEPKTAGHPSSDHYEDWLDIVESDTAQEAK